MILDAINNRIFGGLYPTKDNPIYYTVEISDEFADTITELNIKASGEWTGYLMKPKEIQKALRNSSEESPLSRLFNRKIF